jgi:hypothetical protein
MQTLDEGIRAIDTAANNQAAYMQALSEPATRAKLEAVLDRALATHGEAGGVWFRAVIRSLKDSIAKSSSHSPMPAGTPSGRGGGRS